MLRLIKSPRKLIIGVVHLLPLPGSPRYRGSMRGILERARADVDALIIAGGVDGVILENFGDSPFHKEHSDLTTITSMTKIAVEVKAMLRKEHLLGINLLRNDAAGALAIATAAECNFIRVNVHTGVMFTDQGIIEGRADQTLRIRAQLKAPISIFADIAVKHATPPPGFRLEDCARDCVQRGHADAVIMTGYATGSAVDLQEVERVRKDLPKIPIFVGSGVNVRNIRETLALADGVIVGTSLKIRGETTAPVDVNRVKELVAAVRSTRPQKKGNP